jgi:hypothetical protein
MSNAKDPYVEVPAGATVFSEGEVGAELYIVESGQIKLASRDGSVQSTLGPGDVFGEMALLENQPHAVTASTKGKARLLRIEAAGLPDVLRQNGEIGLCLLRQILLRHIQQEQRMRELAKAATKPDSSAQITEPPPAPPAPAPVSQPVFERELSAPPARLGLLVSGTGQTLALDPARNEFLVGRPDPVSGTTPEIDLGPFDANRTLSRRHARILRDGGQYLVREDTTTTNGTYLNDQRLQTGVAVALKSGDKLRFGSIEVEVVAA